MKDILNTRLPLVALVTVLLIGLTYLVLVNLPGADRETEAPAVTAEEAESPISEEQFEVPRPSDVEEQAAVDSARRFVTAWARPDMPQTTWFDGIRPYLAASLFGRYSTVDPSEVPANIVTGRSNLVESSASQYIVTVPTNTVTMRVVLNGQFKVTYIEPERSGPAGN